MQGRLFRDCSIKIVSLQTLLKNSEDILKLKKTEYTAVMAAEGDNIDELKVKYPGKFDQGVLFYKNLPPGSPGAPKHCAQALRVKRHTFNHMGLLALLGKKRLDQDGPTLTRECLGLNVSNYMKRCSSRCCSMA